MQFLKSKAARTAYAPIDLKLADLFVRDGFRNGTMTPTTTDIEPLGETTIALSGCSKRVPVGCGVKFGSDKQEYTVASRVLTAGTSAVYEIDLGGATGGTYALSYGSATTDSIPFDATNAQIKVFIEAMDTIPQGSIAVADGTGVKTITFQGALASMPITGFTGDMSLLTGATDAQTYLKTAGAYGTGTSSITVSPALEVATTAGGAVSFLGRKLEIKVGEGNLTYNEQVARTYVLDRGRIDTVKNGDDTPMEVTLDFVWEWITGVGASGVPTIEDVLKKINEAADWETTSPDPCEPYCVDIECFYDPGCGGNNTERIVLPMFRYESLNHNLRDAQISCSGKCNATQAIVTRQ